MHAPSGRGTGHLSTGHSGPCMLLRSSNAASPSAPVVLSTSRPDWLDQLHIRFPLEDALYPLNDPEQGSELGTLSLSAATFGLFRSLPRDGCRP